ncbi:FAD/NAD(P)-binding domain-containing protein [Cystobasidium minutum MCA 4210]|uniref:FAD/NAD(P)-binding domain-containing protein n=1 Tax=Cystobasidium minutum MCA 4210 TaxID=1397322 RepID=UPI0034D01944|eukprot:jgi/Rhomi1/204795/MIX5624_28_32
MPGFNNNTMYPTEAQVIVVGAGPVGLFTALLLKHRGVDVVIVERQKALYPLPRAVAFDHESRRLMESVGLGQQLETVLQTIVSPVGGENSTNFNWRDKDFKLIVDLKWEDPTRSGFPIAMGFTQPQLEALLERTVIERGIPLIRGYALRDIQHSKEDVTAQFVYVPAKNGPLINGHGAAELDIKAKYVVGCDGANSTLLKDGYIPAALQKLGNAQICDPNRPTTVVFGGPGRRRFEFMRLPGEDRDSLLTDKMMWELLDKWGYHPDNCMLERKVIYTFKARWANEFYKERVLLAGDALHLMPPFIGQGLNSGIRDAAAIAWRLPLILNGLANQDALFKSFQNERVEHLEKITRHCILLGEAICETDHEKSAELHRTLRANPPPKGFDPPLGKPGTLTDQPESGRLSLHRQIRVQGGAPTFCDQVHGYGWRLVTMEPMPLESLLTEESRHFFLERLGGKCVNIAPEEDITGEYGRWFEEDLGQSHVVLIRPDFYNFGHAHVQDVNQLVAELRSKFKSL